MSHKGNKNNKDNKKVSQKTLNELQGMKLELSNEIAVDNIPKPKKKSKKNK